MRTALTVLLLLAGIPALAQTPKPAVPAKAPAKPPLKITPGQVIVPFDRMRRIWGELIAIDPKTRTGTFRNEGNDEVMAFTIMPYAELLHHASNGDIQDFRVGERAIFRLHENEAGKWVWLTYIQDEMNMLFNHKEYYYVESLDPKNGTITFTQANQDKSFIRDKGLMMKTDGETRFWKAGKPATFADIKVGDALRARTHGLGKGKDRVAWDIFLDDDSLLKFRTEQQAVHAKRMAAEGLPGYVDSVEGNVVKLTLFGEATEAAKAFKAKQPVKLAPAGVDRKPASAPITGTLTEIKAAGKQNKITVTLDSAPGGFKVTELARLWSAR